MKKRFFTLTLGLIGFALAANAQVASLGFEEGDKTYYDPDSTQFASYYADHINLYDGDEWNEQCTEAYSGSYALEANNSTAYDGDWWDRALKLRNLELQEGTSYRVSFYVKADKTFTLDEDASTSYNTELRSALSIGQENLEAPILSQSGTEYDYTWDEDMTGDWRRFAFVTYFTSKEVQDEYFDDYDNNVKEITVNDDETSDTLYWKDYYNLTSFPEKYFLTINMYSAGVYLLDDILVEEATMAGCYYNYDFIQIDFGYPTNIEDLYDEGTVELDASQVTVYDGETQLEVSTLEIKDDGYLYIFMTEEFGDDVENVRVSFTPSDDCPILYSTDQRPSDDVDSDMTVLAFADEPIYLDETLDVLPSSWDAPELLSTEPEDDSFELISEELTTITFTFDKALDLSTASVVITSNGISTDLTDNISLSDDSCSVIVAVSNLADGEYSMTLSGIANSYGISAVEDFEIEFSVGESDDTTESETIYDSEAEFGSADAGTFPVGWISNDGVNIHQYGINDDGTEYDYDWGSTPGGGGCRLMSGYSGDFNGCAIYWRAIEGEEGTLTFGEQVNDYILEDGTIDPEMNDSIALYLEAGKYQISFRNAAWKLVDDTDYPIYDFVLADLDGNEYARFEDLEAKPSVGGSTGISVTGTTLESAEFTVSTEGYYMMKFSAQSNGGYHEYLLGYVNLITMPSKAAYYNQLLEEALDSANTVLTTGADYVYNGDTKTALTSLVDEANNTHYTSPTVITTVIDSLYSLATALAERIGYIDEFDVAIADAQEAMAALEGTKYVNDETYIENEELINNYTDVDASSLSDEELAEVTPQLIDASDIFESLSDVCDALAYRITVAASTARTLGVEDETLIEEGENALTDDDDLADELNNANKIALYKILAETGTISDSIKTAVTSETVTDDDGNYVEATSGVELTGYIKNPNFYTYSTDASEDVTSETVPGWEFIGGVHLEDGYAASETEPVVNSILNGYMDEYTVYQSVSDLPVGIYDIHLRTRTASGYNGVNDETGKPDKYIWASIEEGDTLFTAFEEGSSWTGYPTIIENVTIDENTVLTFGAKEAYLSGKNTDAETGEDAGDWAGNTFVDDARFFMVAPLSGYDYADAYTDGIESITSSADVISTEYYTLGGVRLAKAQRGVNIMKVTHADGIVEVKKVIVK